MKYAVVFESRTGNTAELAEHIKSLISPENLVFFGKPSAYAAQADLIFVGTWTDKGTCCDEIAGFLKVFPESRYLFSEQPVSEARPNIST